MACLHPIWIRNRRYFDKDRSGRLCVHDDHKSALALRPWDIARQYIMVPCGKCEECLRQSRNNWFVRLERELARCKHEHHQAIFLTITINPKYYEHALDDPSWFIRRWNERVRHNIGHSFKHAFFQEFGSHPKMGNEPRLHFHGFLFGLDVSYETLRKAVGDLGWIWIGKGTHKRARYVVKYVVKQIKYDGTDPVLSVKLQHSKYSRKFVSAGVGDYLGTRPAPSASVTSWSYLDFKTGVDFQYSIPRYYNRYLKSEDELIRAVRSSDCYARFSKSSLVRDIVAKCVETFLPSVSALSYRSFYSWLMLQSRKFLAAGSIPGPSFPSYLDDEVLDFWQQEYGISLST